MPKDDLKDILEMVNEWLRFAEAKNGILLSLSIAAATGGHSLGEKATCAYILYVRFALVGLFLLSALICFASFLPKLNSLSFRWKKSQEDDVFNHLYFGSIARMSAYDYERKVAELLKDGKPLDQVERAYTTQISTNAKIAMAKYNYFKVAAIFSGLGIITLGILLMSGIK